MLAESKNDELYNDIEKMHMELVEKLNGILKLFPLITMYSFNKNI